MELEVKHVFTGSYRALPASLAEYFTGPKDNSYVIGILLTRDTTNWQLSDTIRHDFFSSEDMPSEVLKLDIDKALDYCFGSNEVVFDKLAPEYQDDEDDGDSWNQAWFTVTWG